MEAAAAAATEPGDLFGDIPPEAALWGLMETDGSVLIEGARCTLPKPPKALRGALRRMLSS